MADTLTDMSPPLYPETAPIGNPSPAKEGWGLKNIVRSTSSPSSSTTTEMFRPPSGVSENLKSSE